MSLNKVMLIGHVGKDAETKSLSSGNDVTNFTLATSESYTNRQGEKVENTEWHNLVMWNKPKLATYIKKGTQLYVEGQLKTRSWEAQDGTKRYTTEIFVNNIQFVGAKKDGGNTPPPGEPPTGTPGQNMASQKQDDDDLPF